MNRNLTLSTLAVLGAISLSPLCAENVAFPTDAASMKILRPGDILEMGSPALEASVPATVNGTLEVIESDGQKSLRIREENHLQMAYLDLRLPSPLARWKLEIKFIVEELENDLAFPIVKVMQENQQAFQAVVFVFGPSGNLPAGRGISYVFRKDESAAEYINTTTRNVEPGVEYTLIVTGDAETQQLTFHTEDLDEPQDGAFAENVREINRLIIGDPTQEGTSTLPTSIRIKELTLTEIKP